MPNLVSVDEILNISAMYEVSVLSQLPFLSGWIGDYRSQPR